MRKPLIQSVNRHFTALLLKTLPSFEEMKPTFSLHGGKLYRMEASCEVWFFLLLHIHSSEDWFTIEVATSQTSDFSFGPLRGPFLRPNDIPNRFRLPRFWKRSGMDPFWELSPALTTDDIVLKIKKRDYSEPPFEDALANVEPLVQDAIQRIIDFAVPYFESVAAAHQIEIKLLPEKLGD